VVPVFDFPPGTIIWTLERDDDDDDTLTQCTRARVAFVSATVGSVAMRACQLKFESGPISPVKQHCVMQDTFIYVSQVPLRIVLHSKVRPLSPSMR
jgi:hypothetical protein